MARRSNNSERDSILSLILLWLICMIVGFIQQNWDTILIVLIIAGSIGFIVGSYFLIRNIIKHNKLKKAYLASPYYLETKIPYNKSFEERGVKFEIDTYNKIRNAIGPSHPMLTDVLVPQKDAINKDSQIDLILFHSSGIYVIEMKNYSGPLVAGKDDEYWVPYLFNAKSRKNKIAEDHYVRNWAFYNKKYKTWKVYNPILQNKKHIKVLNSIVQAKYINIVLFSDSMFLNDVTAKSMISNVMSVDDFIALLAKENSYTSIFDNKPVYDKIKEYDRNSSPQAKLLHIARVKSRENSF